MSKQLNHSVTTRDVSLRTSVQCKLFVQLELSLRSWENADLKSSRGFLVLVPLQCRLVFLDSKSAGFLCECSGEWEWKWVLLHYEFNYFFVVDNLILLRGIAHKGLLKMEVTFKWMCTVDACIRSFADTEENSKRTTWEVLSTRFRVQ